MASPDNKKSFDFDVVERGYIRKALTLLHKSVVRSRNSDVPGSELYALRSKEATFIDEILRRMA